MTESRQSGQSTREAPLWLRLAAPLFAAALRLLGATWRLRVTGANPLEALPSNPLPDTALRDEAPPNEAPIGIAWHAGVIAFAWFFRDRGVSVGVSLSRDGDSISAALEPLGYAAPVRGSTSRGGGEALWQLVARQRGGSPLALLVDGPRGPAGRSKPGAAAISRRSKQPLTPLGCDARPAIRFASWDRTLLPLPFARVAIHFGEPVWPSEPPGEGDSAPLDRAIEAAQAAATRSLIAPGSDR